MTSARQILGHSTKANFPKKKKKNDLRKKAKNHFGFWMRMVNGVFTMFRVPCHTAMEVLFMNRETGCTFANCIK